MISRVYLLFGLLCVVSEYSPAATGDDSFRAPDSLVLKNGRIVRGLIIKNSANAVLIQEEFDEVSYPKENIVRIRDGSDLGIFFTDINRKGDLPCWRVIANDLRTHDEIKSLVEIPATTIDQGEFKNIPYKSFRVNRNLELNIYGDPNDPVGIELGIYGSRSDDNKLRKTLRAYLAGFLTNRNELAALYAIDFKGGTRQAGQITIEITPKTAPDAYGAWWISIYNRNDLNAVRLNEAEYANIIKPVHEVIDKKGRVITHGWSRGEFNNCERPHDEDTRIILRGFYRDRKGDFRLIK